MPATLSKINLLTTIIICMNAMIGSGIFTAPAALVAQVGPAGIVTYLFVMLAVWCIALSLARLSVLFPHEGSFYAYTKEWMGHTGALMTCFLYIGGMLLAMGLLVHTATFYLQLFFPTTALYTLGIGTVVVLILCNMLGLVLSQLGQHILIVLTLFPLLAITILCLLNGHISYLQPFAPYGFAAAIKATPIVIFGFFGFEAACSLFPIVANPGKNIARALSISILAVGCMYMIFISALIIAIPQLSVIDPTVPLSQILTATLPSYPWLIHIIHISILSAVIGTLHSMIWSVSTLLVSLLKKIQSIQSLYKYIPIHHRQKGAVLCAGIIIFISFSTITKIHLFFSLTALGIVVAYILSMITLLFMRNEWQSGRNIITVTGIATGLTIAYCAAYEIAQEFIKITQ